MFKFILLATLVFFCVNASSDNFGFDKCPQMEPMPLFDMAKFAGVWYGVQADKNLPVCEIIKITQSGEPFSYVMSTETRVSTANHKYRTKSTETLTVPDADFLAKMSVSPVARTSDLLSLKISHTVQTNFTVVETDYDTYAIVFHIDGQVIYDLTDDKAEESCNYRAQVWSRTPALSVSFTRKVNKIIDSRPLESLLYNLNEIKNRTGCVSNSVHW